MYIQHVSLRLLNYAHIIHKSRQVQAELFKGTSAKVFAMTALIAGRDASLIGFLRKKLISVIYYIYTYVFLLSSSLINNITR